MKLRIRGNSVRLRLTRGEIATLDRDGELSDTTRFGPNATLSYRVRLNDDADHITARLSGSDIAVDLPGAAARRWCESDEVGIGATLDTGDGSSLGVLVEKDFACLSPREGEDESDMFPHPEAGAKTC